MTDRMSQKEYRELMEKLDGSKRTKSKYKTAPAIERRWRGRTWDSKAEMLYGQRLQQLKDLGHIIEYINQPTFYLPDETSTYRPDFLIMEVSGNYVVDVKGYETSKFKRDKKRWAKHGRLELHVIKRKGKGWETIEIIQPGFTEKP